MRTKRAVVRQVIAQHGLELDYIPVARLRALIPVLERARVELEIELAKWLRYAPAASERFTAHHLRNALLHVRRAQRSLGGFAEVREAMESALISVGQDATIVAIAHVERQLAVFGDLFGYHGTPVAFDTAAILAARERQMIPRFVGSARRYTQAMQEEIARVLARGVAKNQSFEGMIRALQKQARKSHALGAAARSSGQPIADLTGALWQRNYHWAERLVRTEAVNAYNVGHLEALGDAGTDDPELRKAWSAFFDSRLCRHCRELDGVVVKLDEDFAPGVPHPTLHPN